MKNKYTIEDLKNGYVICENDGTYEEISKVLNALVYGTYQKYYWYKSGKLLSGNDLLFCNSNLPTQSVKDFLPPAQPSKLFYTEATDRLKELHAKNDNTPHCNPDDMVFFINFIGDDGMEYWTGVKSIRPDLYKGDNYEHVTEQEFIKRMGLSEAQYQPHYNNDNGSLYKLAESLGLNHWEFDILKRLVRCRKKGQFASDLKKIKDTCDIYLKEFGNTDKDS